MFSVKDLNRKRNKKKKMMRAGMMNLTNFKMELINNWVKKKMMGTSKMKKSLIMRMPMKSILRAKKNSRTKNMMNLFHLKEIQRMLMMKVRNGMKLMRTS